MWCRPWNRARILFTLVCSALISLSCGADVPAPVSLGISRAHPPLHPRLDVSYSRLEQYIQFDVSIRLVWMITLLISGLASVANAVCGALYSKSSSHVN